MALQEGQNGEGAGKVGAEGSVTAFKLHLFVEAPKASDAVQFYKTAFGAVETDRTTQPKRKAEQELPHISATLQLAGFTILVSDLADGSVLAKGPGAGFSLCLDTKDVEAVVAKAVGAGAVADGDIVKDEVGGSAGRVKDAYGFSWVISSPAKEVIVVAVGVESSCILGL